MTGTIELVQVAEVFNGKTPAKEDQRSSGHPVLKIRDIDDDGRFRGTFESFVDIQFARQFQHRMIRAGDILILNAAHNADYVGSKIALAGAGVAGSLATGEWLIVRPTAADARFVYYWLTSLRTRRALRDLVKGIHLYPKDVAQLSLPNPSVLEQRRIADILDKADAIRRKRKEAIALAEELLRSAFLESFGDPITNPKGWPVEPLGRYLGFVTSGSRGWAEHYADHGDRFIRSLDVQMDRISDEEAAYVTAPISAEAERTRVKEDDVLLTITGSKIGRAARATEQYAGAFVSQHVAILRLLPGLDADVTAAYLVNDRGGQTLIARSQYGQTKPGLNLAQIRAFPIPVPPISIQRQVRDVRARLRQGQEQLAASLRASEELFLSLIHRSFVGAAC